MRLMLASAIVSTSAALTALAIPTASAETRNYNLSGFTKIEAGAGFEIEFTQSPNYSVVVDSRFNNLDKIIVEKEGDTLRIRRPKNTRIEGDVHDVIRISAPDIDGLKLNAAVEFTAAKLHVDKLDIDANAAIRIDIADLRVDVLDVDMDAASKLVLGGTCSRFVLTLGAASTVDARNLKCRQADIDAGVASKVHAFASEKAVAKAGMSSSVLVSGKPRDFQKTTERFGSTVALAD